MIPEPNEKDYTNSSICKECGGHCCKKCPGEFIPSDFGEDKISIFTNILRMLKNGTLRFHSEIIQKDFDTNIPDHSIAVDVISPATKPESRNVWGWGECVFLSDSGCKLSFSKRPTVCKYLIPCEDHKCRTKLLYEFVYLQWLEYSDMVSCLRSLNRRMRKNKPISLSYPRSLINRKTKLVQYLPWNSEEVNNDYLLQHCYSSRK